MRNLLTLAIEKLDPGDINIPTTSGNELLMNGLNIVYFAAGIIAVLVIVIAGIMYTSSGGDQKTVGMAKNLLLFSIIGLVVIGSAFVVTQFVIGRL